MIRLRSLGGEDGEALGGDVAVLADLSVEGRRAIWQILGPALAEPLPPSLEAAGRAFAQAHGLPDLELARGLRALRHVLLGACRRNLDASDVAEDLVLLGTDGELGRTILARYDEAKAAVREGLLQRLLLEHGSVLTGSAWRLDAIVAGTDGTDFRAPVTLLTLGYEVGARRERLTLQVTPAELRGLYETVASALAELSKRR